ncbi:hypothetical protein [Kordia jejudonensis]|uniref:hypothetical protein n=1 Tax=Kordia jejudonensis TaxID=1348245 RepID=UPI0006290008|nr:hypothetical protein [Kordia jejudonensis]
MGAPHNKKRYGEVWQQDRISLSLMELQFLRKFVTLSGGWAWHFLSPEGHTEYKHAHDHKDIDVFVDPKHVAEVMYVLHQRNFKKVWTRYDHLQSEESFRRYEKTVKTDEGKSIRITIDFFVKSAVPSRFVKDWNVVDPTFLLSLYNNIHSSDKCWAVQASIGLLAKNIDPLDREELVTIPKE